MDHHQESTTSAQPMSFRIRRRSIGMEEQGIHESSRNLNNESVTTASKSDSAGTKNLRRDKLSMSHKNSSSSRSLLSASSRSQESVKKNSQEFHRAQSVRNLMSPNPGKTASISSANPRIQELTINKLKYDSVGLVGRDKEVAKLRACCRRACQSKKKQWVVIQGASGLGKSSLCQTVQEQIIAGEGIYGTGKFHLESSAHPYSGLVDALNLLYQQASEKDNFERLRKELSLELGADVTLLAALIPALETLAPADLLVKHRSGLMQELYNPEAEQAKWKHAFKVFIRVLSQHCSPVVLIMDDLHWADPSSLNVMEDLLSDSFNQKSLMIVGTIRSDALDAGHVLSKTIQRLENKKKKFEFDMTQLEPQNLQLKDVHQIIMALLGMDDENATQGLAEICFKRTHGNPSFVVQFIAMLEEEGLLTFNLGLLKWVWDDKLIENETMSTENVVDLLQLRMKKLSFDLRLILQYAACLGSTFDPTVLTLLWEKHGYSVDESKSMSTNELLVKLVKSNFLESHGEYYRWVHDKIQETALEMEEARRSSFYFEVGSTLLNDLPEDKLDVLLFVVTNLINKSNVHGRVEFAKLNLRAAEKAQRLSAFFNGASYAAQAIKLLPNNKEKWTDHRETALLAYTMGAEMEVATGNVDIAREYCEVILKRDDYTALEKYRLYMVKINILCFVNVQYKAAIAFCLDVLKEFDCKLFSSSALLPVHTIRSLKKTIKLAKNTTRAEYRSLKPSDDAKLEAVMTVLGRMNYACAQSKKGLLLALNTVKMVNITLEHGLFSFSGAAQCILGMVCLAALGDIPSATYFAEMGVLMQNSIPSTHFLATTMLVSQYMVLPWSQPFGACRPQLRIGYLEGIRNGNPADGIWCLLSDSMIMPMLMGMNLNSIVEVVQPNIRLAEELKQTDQVFVMKLYQQVILELIGESDQGTVVSSISVHNDEDSQALEKAKNKRAMRSICDYITFVYCGDFDEAANLSLAKGGVYRRQFKGDPVGVFESFLRGLALFAMARQTKRRRFRKPAAKILRFMAKQKKQGNPNVHHYFTLLSAEQAALNKDKKEAKKLYQESIVYAARTGQLNHAALSNERYSDFLLNDLQDLQEAKYRMDEAIRFYTDWGAQGKVDMLQGSSHY